MASYEGHEAMVVTRWSILCWESSIFSFTQCVQNRVPNIPLQNSLILWSVYSTCILPISIAKKIFNPVYIILPHSALQQWTAVHCTALHCTTLHFTSMHCTTLHFTALHSTALQCAAAVYLTTNGYLSPSHTNWCLVGQGQAREDWLWVENVQGSSECPGLS